MLSAVLFIGVVSIVELIVGVALLALLFSALRKTTWRILAKRASLIIVGVMLASPAPAPAGSAALIPLPLGVLLASIREWEDVTFLFRTYWFIVPSMLVTGLLLSYVAHRLFPYR